MPFLRRTRTRLGADTSGPATDFEGSKLLKDRNYAFEKKVDLNINNIKQK